MSFMKSHLSLEGSLGRQKIKAYSILGILLFLFIIHCNNQPEGKIPITTSSVKARKLFIAGRHLADKLREQEAFSYFKMAIERDPQFAMAHLSYALTHSTASDFFDELETAVSLVDSVSQGEKLIILSVQAGANGFPLKQLQYLETLTNAYPEDERAHNWLGTYYFTQQEYNRALGEYRRAIEINPDFSPPYNQLGYSHKYLGNYSEAEEAFKKYIELIPNDPNPYDSYAELLMKMGEFKESIKIYQKALKIDPHFVPSHIGIASNFNFLEKHQQARNQLARLIQSARNDADRRSAYFATAVSYVDEGRADSALIALHKQYQIAKDNHEYYHMANDLFHMGDIHYEQGQIEQAGDHYKRGLATIVSSNLSEEVIKNIRLQYIYKMAFLDLAENRLKKAKVKMTELRAQAKERGNRYQLWHSYELEGLIAMKEKKYDEALGQYRRSNLQNPYNIYRMAIAYQRMGDITKAREFYQKAANHHTLNSLSYAFIRRKAEKILVIL